MGIEEKLAAIFYEGLDTCSKDLECPFDTKIEHAGKGAHNPNSPTTFHQMQPSTAFASGTKVGDMTPDLAKKKDFEVLKEQFVRNWKDINNPTPQEFHASLHELTDGIGVLLGVSAKLTDFQPMLGQWLQAVYSRLQDIDEELEKEVGPS